MNRTYVKKSHSSKKVSIVIGVLFGILIGCIVLSIFSRKGGNDIDTQTMIADAVDMHTKEEEFETIGTVDILAEEGVEDKNVIVSADKMSAKPTVDNSNMDTNKNPVNNHGVNTCVPTDDESVISPYMQTLILAGYGNVVVWGDGAYGVLVHKDMTANGKEGWEIIREYLAEMDLEPIGGKGGIIDEANDWYFCEVLEVRELITPDEDEFWD